MLDIFVENVVQIWQTTEYFVIHKKCSRWYQVRRFKEDVWKIWPNIWCLHPSWLLHTTASWLCIYTISFSSWHLRFVKFYFLNRVSMPPKKSYNILEKDNYPRKSWKRLQFQEYFAVLLNSPKFFLSWISFVMLLSKLFCDSLSW